MAEDLKLKRIKSFLISNDKEPFLLSEIDSSPEKLESTQEFNSYGVELNRNIHKMIVFPGTYNLETGKKCEIKKVFK